MYLIPGELYSPRFVHLGLIFRRRENTVLRAHLRPGYKRNVYVIPSAVIPEQFEPATLGPDKLDTITIVVVSRLTYRKGVDLLVAIAPRICKEYPNVRFLVGQSAWHTSLISLTDLSFE